MGEENTHMPLPVSKPTELILDVHNGIFFEESPRDEVVNTSLDLMLKMKDLKNQLHLSI